MYKGDLVLKEIPYSKRKIKWSYDVIADRTDRFKKGDIIPSKVVMRYLINGHKIELINENDESICILGCLSQ